MGRSAVVLGCHIYDDEGENVLVPDRAFIKILEKMYNITWFWHFDVLGSVSFVPSSRYKEKEMDGFVDNNIKALLEVAKKYERSISGSFSFDEETGGGSTHGFVYIAKDFTAMVYEFNSDVNISELHKLRNLGAPTRRIIQLDGKRECLSGEEIIPQ